MEVHSETSAGKDAEMSAGKDARSLTLASIEVAIDPQKRSRATWIVIAASFIDIACAIILQPNHPMMCANAPKAARPEAWPEGYVHPQAFPDSGMPEYQWAVTLILVTNQICQSISQVVFGILSDKIGRKPCMLINIAGGAVSMVLFWLAGNIIKNYWSYVAFQAISGLFGAMKGVGQNYIQDINEPADFRRLQPLIITAMTFGGVGGGLLGGVLNAAIRVDEHSGDLFAASIVGLVGAVICFLAVLVYCPNEPPKPKLAPWAKGDTDPAGKEKKAASATRRILILLVIAGGFDAFGDNGNTFARTVIFSNRYPEGKAPVWNTILLAVKCAGVFLAMMIVTRSAKRVRLPLWTVIGNLFSAGCQFGVIPNAIPMGGFLAVWGTSQCFGFTSTMANLFLLPAFAPAETRGFWIGINNSVLMLCMACAPLTLSGVYSALAPPAGSGRDKYADAEMASMLACGSISLFAAVLYSNLLCLIPKPPPPQTFTLTKDDLDKYNNMPMKEFTRLPAEERDAVFMMMLQDGKEPNKCHWISYQEDLADGDLLNLATLATADFDYIEKKLHSKLQDVNKLTDELVRLDETNALLNAGYDTEQERKMMGNWIADYFDDAGYHAWLWFPGSFKAMIMNAFPALTPLDGKPASFHSVKEYQAYILGFNRVMKRHVAMQQRAETAEGIKNMTAKAS